MTNASQRPGLLFLHASSVITEHGLLLFMGPSGTGKSTICRMLADRYAPLADDVTCLWPIGGNQWHGDDGRLYFSPFPRQPAPPERELKLAGLFRIYQGPEPLLQRMAPHEACEHLLNAFFEVAGQNSPYDSIQALLAFRKLASLARHYPVWRYSYPLALDSLTVIHRLVESWGSQS